MNQYKIFNTAPSDCEMFTAKGIINVEIQESARYIGEWAVKTKNGAWSEQPVPCFFSEEYGYFALYSTTFTDGSSHIMRADVNESLLTPMHALLEDGIVYVSRFRHDYVVTPKGSIIDGGRDYTRGGNLAKETTPVILQANKKGQFEVLYAEK